MDHFIGMLMEAMNDLVYDGEQWKVGKILIALGLIALVLCLIAWQRNWI